MGSAGRPPAGSSGNKHGFLGFATLSDGMKTESQATYDDVNLILRLYELRREPKLREARKWFAESFRAKTVEEVAALCPPGSEANAFLRMVTSYWEMAASFVGGGVLNQELFFQNCREMLFVWERIRDTVPKAREIYQDPSAFKNMETVAKAFIQWMNRQSPGMYPEFAARVRGEKAG